MKNETGYGVDENYEEYIKGFIKTDEDALRRIPNMRGVKDFDFVDEYSKDNGLSGYASKHCVRANVMLLRDLVKEIQTNPDSSYQLCYTAEEIIAGDYPEYFSVYMKNPGDVFSVESEVFASRLLNYFQIPVAYNRRIDKAIPKYKSIKYVMSVDMIRRNERLVLLKDIVPFVMHLDISRIDKYGLKATLDLVGESLKIYLDGEGVIYTEQDIEDYKRYLSGSLLVRRLFLRDSDLRNGNAGILIDVVNKKFRALPNFDMEKSFGSLVGDDCLLQLKEFYELYTEDYEFFIDKLINLIDGNEKKISICEKMANKYIRSEVNASCILYRLYTNAYGILEETKKFKKALGDGDKNEGAKQFLA